jgi:hypothetical protein
VQLLDLGAAEKLWMLRWATADEAVQRVVDLALSLLGETATLQLDPDGAPVRRQAFYPQEDADASFRTSPLGSFASPPARSLVSAR